MKTNINLENSLKKYYELKFSCSKHLSDLSRLYDLIIAEGIKKTKRSIRIQYICIFTIFSVVLVSPLFLSISSQVFSGILQMYGISVSSPGSMLAGLLVFIEAILVSVFCGLFRLHRELK